MIPSTGTMAILFAESLSSTTAPSSLGPAVLVCAAVPFKMTRRRCSGLNTRLITSKQANSTTATFQPLPFLGGAAARRGGGNNGGGVGTFGGLVGGTLLS